MAPIGDDQVRLALRMSSRTSPRSSPVSGIRIVAAASWL
jgi:hypothetical protein